MGVQCQVLDLDLLGDSEPVLMSPVVGFHIRFRKFPILQEFAKGQYQKAEQALLVAQSNRVVQFTLGNERARLDGAGQLRGDQTQTHSILKVLGTQPLKPQVPFIRGLIEAAVFLKTGNTHDQGANHLITGIQTEPGRLLDDQFSADHVLQNLLAHSSVIEQFRSVGTAELFPQVGAQLLISSIKFPFSDLPVVDTGDHRLRAAPQILLDAPECERNGNQNHYRPGDPPLCAIPDSL